MPLSIFEILNISFFQNQLFFYFFYFSFSSLVLFQSQTLFQSPYQRLRIRNITVCYHKFIFLILYSSLSLKISSISVIPSTPFKIPSFSTSTLPPTTPL